ncbi:hypothetical protein V6N11_074519 [Hibiscus sabdariffa]|uniref:Uncharacterized protein n=1 Tax=Hibiscus sabdariffa TaxID=183260 RepID=A0ABR2R472_9ROSI
MYKKRNFFRKSKVCVIEVVWFLLQNVLKSPVPEFAECSYPENMEMIFIYSAFVKEDHTYFDIQACGVDGTQLYPHLKFTTVSEHLDTLV